MRRFGERGIVNGVSSTSCGTSHGPSVLDFVGLLFAESHPFCVDTW